MRQPSRSQRRDVALRFGGQAIVSVGNVAFALLLARMVGPVQFGVFALVWTAIALAQGLHWALIASPMQSSLATSEATEQPGLLGTLITHASALAACSALGAVLVLWVMAPANSSAALQLAAAGAATAVVLQEFSRRWLLATARPARALAADVLRHGGTLLGLALLYRTHHETDLSTCLAILAVSSMAAAALMLGDIRKAAFTTALLSRHSTHHLRMGRWLLPSVLLQTASATAPIFALGHWSSIEATGGYRAALTLMAPLISATEALETFLPLRARQRYVADGSIGLYTLMRRWALRVGSVCALYLLVTVAFRNELLAMAFGAAYREHAAILLPIAVANLAQFAVYILNVSLRGIGHVSAIVKADLVSTGLLFLLLSIVVLWSADRTSPLLVAACAAAYQWAKLVLLAMAVHAHSTPTGSSEESIQRKNRE